MNKMKVGRILLLVIILLSSISFLLSETNEEKANTHYNLGLEYSGSQRWDKAIEECKLAIKYKSDYAEAHYNLGVAYGNKGLTDKAIDEFKLAIKYKPDYADAHYNLGVVYGKKGRTTTSADYFYRAGLLYLQQNNRESVLRTIDAMKDYAPNSPLISLLTEKLYANNDSISKNENVQYSGSGFIIDKTGLIVTNYHIIKGMKNIEIYIPSRDIQYEAEILIKDINNDIVILKINDHKFVKEFINIPFSMGSSSVIKEGQDIFTIGFPMKDVLGKSAKLSTGIISSLYGFLDNPTLVQISNPIQPGNSGSPLFNSNGEVVGIVVSSLSASYFYENEDIIPQNVNFAIKVDYLKNIISIINNGDKILSRKSQIRNLPLETQFKKIKPFIVIVKAY